MRKLKLMIVMLTFLLGSFAMASSDLDRPKRTLHHQLYAYAKKICNVDEDLPGIVTVYIEWFVMQKFYPDMAKTFTSMYNGMNNLASRSAPMAVCVGKFISIPKNDQWEKNLDLDAKATKLGVHPPVILTEVYEDGTFDVRVNPLY